MSCLTYLVFSCVYCFFLNKMIKLYKDICSAWIRIFVMHEWAVLCRNFFHTDWSHKRLKNTIDLLLFYGENFYGFSESVYENFLRKVQPWKFFIFSHLSLSFLQSSFLYNKSFGLTKIGKIQRPKEKKAFETNHWSF